MPRNRTILCNRTIPRYKTIPQNRATLQRMTPQLTTPRNGTKLRKIVRERHPEDSQMLKRLTWHISYFEISTNSKKFSLFQVALNEIESS